MLRSPGKDQRRGAALVLIALLIVPLLCVVAFAIDYGYLVKVRNDLQCAADMTALAAVRELTPAADGSQNTGAVIDVAKDYAAKHFGDSFRVLDADVQMGRFDPDTIYSQVDLLNTGMWDTVRVTLRRDASANSPVSLFFAPIFGVRDSDVAATATAVLQKGRNLKPGVAILPFSVLKDEWNLLSPGASWYIYGDGKVEDQSGNQVPGNWGTLDIGDNSNSTADLEDQMVNGLRQSDLDALYEDGRIPQDTHIDAMVPVWLEADTGLSSGLKSGVQAIHGKVRIVPLYEAETGSPGNNLEFYVADWGVAEVVDSNWGGSKRTYVQVRKAYIYDANLTPVTDLSATSGYLPGAFTSPVLVE